MARVDPEELLGSISALVSFIDTNTSALTAKGLTPATIKTAQQAALTDMNAKKVARDDKRTALTNAQRAFETSAADNYSAFSNAIDIISGAVGKTTAEGKQVLALRKNVTGANRRGSSSSSSSSSS